VVAAGLDESVPDAEPYVLHGRYLNLFDPDLPVLNTVTIAPGSRMLLLDLNAFKPGDFKVVAAACRVRDQKSGDKTLEFRAEGIGDTNSVIRIAAPRAASEILVGGTPLQPSNYDYTQGTLRLRFPNSVAPVPVVVRLAASSR